MRAHLRGKQVLQNRPWFLELSPPCPLGQLEVLPCFPGEPSLLCLASTRLRTSIRLGSLRSEHIRARRIPANDPFISIPFKKLTANLCFECRNKGQGHRKSRLHLLAKHGSLLGLPAHLQAKNPALLVLAVSDTLSSRLRECCRSCLVRRNSRSMCSEQCRLTSSCQVSSTTCRRSSFIFLLCCVCF